MDLVIKNGFIIDGTGNPGFVGDIRIQGDYIRQISPSIEGNGEEILDAKGKVVSPGFIDLHHHGDMAIMDALLNIPTVMQGVTTIFLGLCGLGVTPANDRVKEYYFNYITKAFGGSNDLFETQAQLMDVLESKGVSANIGFLLPQGNVRAYIMGTERRAASTEELEKMKRIVRDSMEAGAFGMSTGLVYPPGSNTPTEELIELSKIVREYNGIYMSHMRNEGARILEIGIPELLRIARESQVHAHISHWSVLSKKAAEMTPKVIQVVCDAREKENLPITADVTVYNHGSTSLSFVLFPMWVYEDFNMNLTNPVKRQQLIEEIFKKLYDMFFADAPFYIRLLPKKLLKKLIFRGLSKSVSVISTKSFTHVEGKSLELAFQELYPGKAIEEALLDLIHHEEGQIMIDIKSKDELGSIIPIYLQEFVSPISDGFYVVDKNTHPNSYGAFIHVLERFVRELHVVTLPEAIRKMTSLPAHNIGLEDRGVLKEGMKADLVIFDPELVKEKGTLMNGRQHPEGIEAVIINGKLTVYHGRHLGVKNGRILRHHS